MITFTATIKRFGKQGEKTGWTYIEVPSSLAEKLQPGSRKSFRVKGQADRYKFSMVALMPMGGGDYIMNLNAQARKAIQKPVGEKITVKMEVDKGEILPPSELIECLQDEPEALDYFQSLPKGHRNYFSNWIYSAKTESTRAKRIAATVNACLHRWDYGQMIRSMKEKEY